MENYPVLFKNQLALALEADLERNEMIKDYVSYEERKCYKTTIRYLRTGRYSPMEEEMLKRVGKRYLDMLESYIFCNSILN
jgi:hypothetical protein